MTALVTRGVLCNAQKGPFFSGVPTVLCMLSSGHNGDHQFPATHPYFSEVAEPLGTLDGFGVVPGGAEVNTSFGCVHNKFSGRDSEGNFHSCPECAALENPSRGDVDRVMGAIDKSIDYNFLVLAKIWSIIKPNEEAEYDTNNLYERLRELVSVENRLEGLK